MKNFIDEFKKGNAYDYISRNAFEYSKEDLKEIILNLLYVYVDDRDVVKNAKFILEMEERNL